MCLLKKLLYGLKRLSRQWYKRFNLFITIPSFIRINYNSCMHFRNEDGRSITYLFLYVDDILITAKDEAEVRKMKSQLSKEF